VLPGDASTTGGSTFFLQFAPPIAMDRVFGDFRLNVGYVFDVADARLFATLQAAAAIGTVVRPMLGSPVDALRCLAPRAGMTVLRAGPFLAARFDRRLLISRDHARRSRRRGRRIDFPLRLGESLRQFQQGKDHGLSPLLVNRDGLPFGQHRGNQSVLRRPVQFHARRHALQR
jgi:hypothetical protein